VSDVLVYFWFLQQAMVLAGYLLLSCLTMDASAIKMRRRRREGYTYEVPEKPFPPPSQTNVYLPPASTPSPPKNGYLPPAPPSSPAPEKPSESSEPSHSFVYFPSVSPNPYEKPQLPPIFLNCEHPKMEAAEGYSSSHKHEKRDVKTLCSPR
jgi:hypothetical protein